MNALLAIAGKDLRLLLRDRVALFWALGFPLVFALIFGSIHHAALDLSARRMTVELVDEDGSPRAEAIRAALVERREIDLRPREAAASIDDVRRGDAIARVRIPRGFAADGAPIELTIDPTHEPEGAFVFARVQSALVAAQPPSVGGVAGRSASEPAAIAVIRASRADAGAGYRLVFPAAILWGLIGCAGAFAVSLVSERAAGTHLRLRAAPIAATTAIAGKFLACLVACLIDAAVLLLLAVIALGVRPDRPIAVLGVVVATAIGFSGATMLLGTLGKTAQSVGGASWGALLLMALAGGAMVPIAVMPSWLRVASAYSPVRWGIAALEGATWRGASTGELGAHMVALLALGLGGIVLGAAITRRSAP